MEALLVLGALGVFVALGRNHLHLRTGRARFLAYLVGIPFAAYFAASLAYAVDDCASQENGCEFVGALVVFVGGLTVIAGALVAVITEIVIARRRRSS